MRERVKLPIESFGPELMAALLKGSREEFSFPLPYSEAVRFRRRIHQLRARMREENHPERMLVERARVSIIWGTEAGYEPIETRRSGNMIVPKDTNALCKVRIKPYDTEFGKALEAAGVKIDSGSDIKLPGSDGTTKDFLAEFDPTPREE